MRSKNYSTLLFLILASAFSSVSLAESKLKLPSGPFTGVPETGAQTGVGLNDGYSEENSLVRPGPCVGDKCEKKKGSFEGYKKESELMLDSPFGTTKDFANSNATANMALRFAKSPYGLNAINMGNQSGVMWSGVQGTIDQGLSLAQADYAAQKHIKDTLSDSPEGAIASESIQNCLAKAVKSGGYGFKALERCVENEDKPIIAASQNGNFFGAKIQTSPGDQLSPTLFKLDYSFYPGHPLNDKNKSSQFTSLLGKRAPNSITLSDILFNEAILSSKDANEAKFRSDNKAKFVQLFGDVVYKVDKPGAKPGMSYLHPAQEQKAPSFTYQDAMLSVGLKPEIKLTNASPYEQFVQFKKDTVYYALAEMMHNRCVLGDDKNKDQFWNEQPDSASDSGMTSTEVRYLSSTLASFNGEVGRQLWDTYFEPMKGRVPLQTKPCDALNPAVTPPDDKPGVSIKRLYNLKSNDPFIGFLADIKQFTDLIAQAQINDFLMEINGRIDSLSGGGGAVGSVNQMAREEARNRILLTLNGDWAGKDLSESRKELSTQIKGEEHAIDAFRGDTHELNDKSAK